ncbi:MAG: PKD domain-containing protein, partial [Chitinophagaceae bacterium]
NTTISINGVSVGTYNRGQVYEGFLIGSSAYITTSSPAYVTQLTGNGGEMTSVNLPTITCTGSQSVAFVRSTPEDFQLNILCKASQVNSFFINGVGGLINASHFEDVPSTNGVWKAARISLLNLPNINALIPAAITTVITNSTGLFHLGFVNGTANTGSRIGYFSNYSNRNLAPSINGNRCIGSNISIKVNNFENASYTWKGPGNFTVNPFDPSRIDITNAQLSNAGKYYMTANIPGCGFYEDSIELVLNTPPTAVLNPSEILCFGYGKSMTMTISGGTGPWNITYFDGNNIQTTQKLIDPFFSFPANNTTTKTYQILSVTDNLGCKTENPGMTPISSSTITVVPLPTAKFAGPDSVCSGKTLDLGLNFTGKAPWSFVLSTFVNDITNNSQYTYSHIPQTGGNITILTVADGNGCVANNTDTKFIRLLNNPIANFDVSAENCLGTTTTVTNASSGNGNDIKSYAWELSDGTKYSTPTFSHQFTQAGTKNIALQITSTNGCVSDVFSKSTQINPVPIADFQIIASSFCTNKPVSLVNNSQENGLPLVNFYWTMSDGTTYTKTNNNSFDHSFSNSGLATVSLQAENTKGCKSNIVTKNTTIHPNPIAGFKMPEICLSDGKARFVDTSFVPGNSNASFTYSWQFNTGNPAISPSPTPINSTVKNPEITFFKAANYEILQTVTSAQGCVAQSLQKFTVNGSLPKAAFSIANAVTSICANESITVKNESTVDFGSITKLEIYWNANGNIADKLTDNNPASEKTYTHQYALINSTQPQQFTVRVIAFSGDICSDVTEKTITVYPRAVIQFPAIKSICNDSLPRLINIARELTGLAGNF